MAKVISFNDDLDGSSDAETRYFAIGRRTYEIDLCASNYDKLEKSLARYIKVARDVTPVARRPASDAYDGVDQSVVRAWAIETGRDVQPQGRIPLSLVEQYRQARQAPDPADTPNEPAS